MKAPPGITIALGFINNQSSITAIPGVWPEELSTSTTAHRGLILVRLIIVPVNYVMVRF
jgi:hypothetical protein